MTIYNRGIIQRYSLSICSLATTIQLLFALQRHTLQESHHYHSRGMRGQEKTEACLRNQQRHVRKERKKRETVHICNRQWHKRSEMLKERRERKRRIEGTVKKTEGNPQPQNTSLWRLSHRPLSHTYTKSQCGYVNTDTHTVALPYLQTSGCHDDG